MCSWKGLALSEKANAMAYGIIASIRQLTHEHGIVVKMVVATETLPSSTDVELQGISFTVHHLAMIYLPIDIAPLLRPTLGLARRH